MKKLLTLFTLLLTVCSGAWGTTTNSITLGYSFWGRNSETSVSSSQTFYGTYVDSERTFNFSINFAAGSLKSGLISVTKKNNAILTITAPSGYNITKIITTFSSGKLSDSNYTSTDPENTNDNPFGDATYTWDGSANSVAQTFNRQGGACEIKSVVITYESSVPAIPTLTGAWKIGDNEITSVNVIQGGSVTMPTFTVGATSGNPSGMYNVSYAFKSGYQSGIFEESEGNPTITSNQPSIASTAITGTATIVATLTTTDAKSFAQPTTNTFEYTVTVNAPAAPTFSPDASAVASGTEITMTSPDGGEIWYTTSGVDPTESNKTVYDAEAKPTITDATTIKAIARVNGYSSAVAEAEYTIKTLYSQMNVTGSTTWDWQNITSASIELSGTTTPKNTDEFVLKNVEVYNDYTIAGFAGDAQQLKVIAQYPFRNDGNGKLLQGDKIQFHTTVPGYVKVTYSNTGGKDNPAKDSEKRPYRYVKVNEMMSEEGSASTTKKTTEAFFVPAGDVAITGYISDANDPYSRSGDNVGAAMLRIYKVEFTEAVPVTVTTAGLATYASDKALDFSGVTGIKAYKASISDKTITFTKMDEVPAGEGMLIRAMSTLDETTTFYVPQMVTPPSSIENAMKRGENAAVIYHPSNDIYNYVLSGGSNGVGFYQANGETVPTDRAYLQSATALAKGFVINYDDEEGEETDGIKAVSTKVENGVRYNLAGQKVGADYKGIVIVNGKKYLRK